MPACTYELTIEKGATFRRQIRFRNADSTYRDFTGYTGRMQIRQGVDAADVFLSLSTEAGSILMDDEGNITLIIPAELTQELEALPGLVYDLEITDLVGDVTRLLEGPVYVRKEVTR